MDSTVEAALIGAASALIGVGGTVIVAITGARNTLRTNQATIDAAGAAAQHSLEAAREGQLADRYSRALEQLGSDNLDVRTGGIYALESIALDSRDYHPTVMEVLTAFIREHSRIPAPGTRPKRWPLPDVATALTVVGRRKVEHDTRPMGLAIADLSMASLRGANFTGADLRSAHLEGADLVFADLTKANLGDAHLNDTQLDYAHLEGADLSFADLSGTNLRHAYLAGAKLTYVTLSLTMLDGAHWPRSHPIPEFWVADSDPETADDTVQLKRADP
jgi:hypothetical protein